MNVEIWSDFVCPFCYIGKRKFEAALEQFAHGNEVEIVYRSFELDPNAPVKAPYDIHDMLSKKYGMSREQAKQMNEGVGQQAKAVGLTYNFDTMPVTNTFDAHRLAHYAAAQGKSAEMTERLLYAHFTETKPIGDKETLADLAAEVGLDRDEAAKVLAGNDYAKEVRADQQDGAALGIRGVPFFVIDRKYGVSGAQEPATFLSALEKAWSESHPSLIMADEGSDGAACSGDACSVPGPGEK